MVLIFLALLAGFSSVWADSPRNKVVLPLKVSDTGRHLVDQKNTPFLVLGDTPWSLIVQPQDQDIDRYLADRQNSIIVNLIEHKFCTAPPRTRSGLSPFDRPGDFSGPNGQYFDFAHQVVQKANERGIVVWLAPAYLGFGGGDEGFFRETKAGGKEKLRAYGKSIGGRFKDLSLTAQTPDRKLAVTYIPSSGADARELTLDGSQFSGPIAARWFNPTNGRFTKAEEALLPNRGAHRFRTPGDNGTQANDWVLVVEAH